jgi:hypothetical protein
MLKTTFWNPSIQSWKMIQVSDDVVVSLHFISPLKGWMSDYIFTKKSDPQKPLAKYYLARNRLKKTEDGGKTWTMIYQSSGIIENIYYENTLNTLFGLKIVLDPITRQPRLHFMAYKSSDNGFNWTKISDLPNGTESFYFFNETDAYAWTLGKIFFTSDRGITWNLMAEMDLRSLKNTQKMPIKDKIIYWIKKNKVIGMNPWSHTDYIIEQPLNFNPKRLLIDPLQAKFYILGIKEKKWFLLTYIDHQLVKEELLSFSYKLHLEFFFYGKNRLHFVGSKFSYFKTYYFYSQNNTGWYSESLSGMKNSEHFSVWKHHMWAIRISLLKGRRELWHRKMISD